MPARKQFKSSLAVKPELERALQESKGQDVPEEVLQEQRVSFAFGNAMSERITKESVRRSSKHVRLKA